MWVKVCVRVCARGGRCGCEETDVSVPGSEEGGAQEASILSPNHLFPLFPRSSVTPSTTTNSPPSPTTHLLPWPPTCLTPALAHTLPSPRASRPHVPPSFAMFVVFSVSRRPLLAGPLRVPPPGADAPTDPAPPSLPLALAMTECWRIKTIKKPFVRKQRERGEKGLHGFFHWPP